MKKISKNSVIADNLVSNIRTLVVFFSSQKLIKISLLSLCTNISHRSKEKKIRIRI